MASRHMTPSSSFSRHDRLQKPPFSQGQLLGSFDLAKLLDPFEQLEREFNWKQKEAAAAALTIKPPSEFGSLYSADEAVSAKAQWITFEIWRDF